MDENQLSKYIKKIVLEILDRFILFMTFLCQRKNDFFFSSYCSFGQQLFCHVEKFNISSFDVRQAAYAFLTQYNGETFVKGQKVKNNGLYFY